MSNKNEHLDVIITRTLKAPRQLVWDAWTQAEHVEKWWGPKGMTTSVVKIDLKEGGERHYIMTSPDGKAFPVIGEFNEIVEPEKIVTTDHFGEEYQKIMPKEMFPKKIVMTILFDEVEEGTELTLTISHMDQEDYDKHMRMNPTHGWNASFDSLVDYLKALASA